jgi:hypothetical protein
VGRDLKEMVLVRTGDNWIHLAQHKGH